VGWSEGKNTQLKSFVPAVTCLRVISCFSPALKMEAIRSSETSVQTRATRCYILEDDILHSHRRENLKAYKFALIYHLPHDTSSTCSLRPRIQSMLSVLKHVIPNSYLSTRLQHKLFKFLTAIRTTRACCHLLKLTVAHAVYKYLP
jgi:hypothetical protein